MAGNGLSIIISLEDRYAGLTLGLLGNNNGDGSDDLQPNNANAPVPVGSSDELIFNDFGETCEWTGLKFDQDMRLYRHLLCLVSAPRVYRAPT